MRYLAASFFGVWLAGLFFLWVRSRREICLALERNEVADRPCLASNIDLRHLTDSGRFHLKRAFRFEDALLFWLLDGFLILAALVLTALP